MSTWNESLLMAALTWPACACIFWTAACRLNAMGGRRVLFRVGVEYAAYMGIAAAVFLAPTIGEWPGFIMLGVVYGIALIMLCQWGAWRGDRPPVTATGNMPLIPHPPEENR